MIRGRQIWSGIMMLRGMVRMDLNRRLKANRALGATMSFLALMGWGVFAYSAGTSAKAEQQLRAELAQSKAAQDQLLAERNQQQQTAGDLTQMQAKLAATREDLETLARRREQARAQVAAAQQELSALAKQRQERQAKGSEKGSAQAAKPPSRPARLAAQAKHDA